MSMYVKEAPLTRARRIAKRSTPDNAGDSQNRSELLQDLARLQGTYCPKLNDRYQLLLKRDALLSKMHVRSTDVKEANKLTSSCPDMCPEKERYMRQVGNQLHPYECHPNGTLNHAAAVKDYARSAADQGEPLPHELRPPNVLKKTMDYLILKINEAIPENELGRWYDFIWSRTRSIRKEITQQMLVDKMAVLLVEKCVRFHIYASFRMASREAKDFDGRMNTENLSKSLQTLRHLYDDLAKRSVFCESEAEFRAYDVLLNLADSNVLSVSHTYRETVRNSDAVKTATQLACYFQTNNYVAFFRLVRNKASFLETCLCRPYFAELRTKAFHTIVKGFRPLKIPISKFTDILAFDDDEDTAAFMGAMKLSVETDGMVQIGAGYQSSDEPPDDAAIYGCKIIKNKLTAPLPEVIAGGPISAPVFPAPVDSFTTDGYYYNDPVLREYLPEADLRKAPANPPPASRILPPSAGSFPPNTGKFAPSTSNNPASTSNFPSFGGFKAKTESGKPSSSLFSQPGASVSTNVPLSAGSLFQRAITTVESSKPSAPPPSIFSAPNNASTSTSAAQFGGGALFNRGIKGLGDTAPKVPSFTAKPPTMDGSQPAAPSSASQAPTFGSFRPPAFSIAPPPVQNEAQIAAQKREQEIERICNTVIPSVEQTSKRELTDDVINHCVDDFVWLAARALIEREQEEKRRKEAAEVERLCTKILPSLSRTMTRELNDDVINYCVDDFIWLAAREVLKREEQVQAMLHKHNMRIVKPYADKWLTRMKDRLFLAKVAKQTLTLKRPSTTPIDGPSSAKRSKKFIPLRFHD